jgi:hypothetical protein
MLLVTVILHVAMRALCTLTVWAGTWGFCSQVSTESTKSDTRLGTADSAVWPTHTNALLLLLLLPLQASP